MWEPPLISLLASGKGPDGYFLGFKDGSNIGYGWDVLFICGCVLYPDQCTSACLVID